MDKLDTKIIKALDKDPLTPIKTIAKKCRTSPQVVEYRLQRMYKQEIIYSIYTIIDYQALGYSAFKLALTIQDATQKEYIVKKLMQNTKIIWIGFTTGKYDILCTIISKTNNTFEKELHHALDQTNIQNYEIWPILEYTITNYGFLDNRPDPITIGKATHTHQIDNIDKIILQNYKNRATYTDISKKTDVSRQTIKKRIQRLEKNHIIAGYKLFLNTKTIGRQTYKLFIKCQIQSKSAHKKLHAYLTTHPQVLIIGKQIGSWTYDLEIITKSAHTLQDFIIELRNIHPIIQDLEIIQIIKEKTIDFLPKNMLKEL